jgi:putative RNA 2'-phosphotransferase
MPDKRLIQVSKLMSLILRHKPDQFGLVLDPEGFVTIEDVISALRKVIPDASIDDVRRVVELIEPDKARFTIAGIDIRANYGHSLSERIKQVRVVPPDVLLHGTSETVASTIRREGIRPMGRQYVHLTTIRDLAVRVGARHGRSRVLEVNAVLASQQGVAFYRANDSFWLADFVPPDFIR